MTTRILVALAIMAAVPSTFSVAYSAPASSAPPSSASAKNASTKNVSVSNVPDAFSVEWKGKHPCNKLYEDAEIRVGLCTFPPGAVHLCHSHPADLVFTIEGGKGQVRNAQGKRDIESKAGSFFSNPPVPWHEFTNIGNTTTSYLIVEKKYQPAAPAGPDACK
ncbi:MAG TPA: cupin domain-containing protein [Rhodopila sp.]|nr:cupin domain-containing protein [Rhodopila sp.]